MSSQTVSVAHGLNPSHRDFLRIQNGCNDCFERLLARWEPLIKSKARTFSAPGCDRADFEQVGRLALYRAVLAYRPGQSQFSTFATALMVRAMIDEQRHHAHEPQPGDVDEAAVEVVRYDDPIIARELTAAIERWRLMLDTRERQVLNLMFIAELKQAAVARRLGLTPARVSQIIRDIRLSAQRYDLN